MNNSQEDFHSLVEFDKKVYEDIYIWILECPKRIWQSIVKALDRKGGKNA